MKNNPFGNPTFKRIWLKHFKNSIPPIAFKSLEHIEFYKDHRLPLYVNVGRNITNGMYYEIDSSQNDYKGKTFLVYDVPGYFNIDTKTSNNLKVKKARQYKGFSCELEDFETFTDFFNHQYKAKSRYKHKRNVKRLEACFDIEYKIFSGEISKEEYDFVFHHLRKILNRRFTSLGLDNDILLTWDYYSELAYEMILKKEAVLTAIYSDGIPISISLGFLSNSVMFFAVTAFDIDYYRFALGHVTIIKLMQWCFDNGFKTFDFSKGEYDYKTRWANSNYDFECHVLYDSKSIKSKILASLTCNYFSFKQFLRDKKVNFLYSKLKFKLRGKTKEQSKVFKVTDIESNKVDINSCKEIDMNSDDFRFLKAPLVDFLYGKPRKFRLVKVYKCINETNDYYAIGEENYFKISLTN